jgi:preprotein translocase subunit SecB
LGNKIKLISQYIKDLSFENYAAQAGNFLKEKPKISIDIKMKRKTLANNILEVTLVLLLEANVKTNKIFLMELSYAGTFMVNNLSKPNQNKRVAFVDCPNIIFPFIRQTVLNVTQSSGYPPLTLDYVDFEDIFDSETRNQL